MPTLYIYSWDFELLEKVEMPHPVKIRTDDMLCGDRGSPDSGGANVWSSGVLHREVRHRHRKRGNSSIPAARPGLGGRGLAFKKKLSRKTSIMSCIFGIYVLR